MIGIRYLDLRIMLTLQEREEEIETHYQLDLLGSKMDVVSRIFITRTIINLIPPITRITHITRITRITRIIRITTKISITQVISIIISKKEGVSTIISIPRITIAPFKRRTTRAAHAFLGNL